MVGLSSVAAVVIPEAVVEEPVEPRLPRVFQACADGLYRFLVVRLYGDRHSADDLLQQTCHEAIRSGGVPNSDDECEAWLFGIARNLVRRHWRRNRQAKRVSGIKGSPSSSALLDAMDAGPLPDELLASEETARELLLAVTSLTAADQLLVFSFYYDGRSQLDLAAEQGVTIKSVEARLYRARARLRAILAKGGH